MYIENHQQCAQKKIHMNKAKVLPVFKKADTRERGNYTPLTLQTSLSKVSEQNC